MATRVELKDLTKARIKTASILINAKDWDMAAYIMGYALETALKASACNALNLKNYPDIKTAKNDKIGNYFMTHNFDMLLVVSGLSDIFSVDGNPAAFQNWSDFTQEYQGDWTHMRYLSGKFSAKNIKLIVDALSNDNDSILKTINREKRW